MVHHTCLLFFKLFIPFSSSIVRLFCIGLSFNSVMHSLVAATCFSFSYRTLVSASLSRGGGKYTILLKDISVDLRYLRFTFFG